MEDLGAASATAATGNGSAACSTARSAAPGTVSPADGTRSASRSPCPRGCILQGTSDCRPRARPFTAVAGTRRRNPVLLRVDRRHVRRQKRLPASADHVSFTSIGDSLAVISAGLDRRRALRPPCTRFRTGSTFGSGAADHPSPVRPRHATVVPSSRSGGTCRPGHRCSTYPRRSARTVGPGHRRGTTSCHRRV